MTVIHTHPWSHVPEAMRPHTDHIECGECADCQAEMYYRCSNCECSDCRDYYGELRADLAAERKSEQERGR